MVAAVGFLQTVAQRSDGPDVDVGVRLRLQKELNSGTIHSGRRVTPVESDRSRSWRRIEISEGLFGYESPLTGGFPNPNLMELECPDAEAVILLRSTDGCQLGTDDAGQSENY